jgi:hypothetical protein
VGKTMKERQASISLAVWYVSYRSNIARRREDKQSLTPATRRFETESDAKQFAEKVIGDGWSVTAGTINPYEPKKVIPSTRVLDWIAGKF